MTQGYIGVTKNTKVRFQEHRRNAKNFKQICKVLEKAIRKYKDLIFEELLISDENYAYSLERKLRPYERIGWNIAKGGSTPSGMLGLKHSDETKLKMSLAKIGKTGGKRSEKTKTKISRALTGRVVSQETRDLQSEQRKGRFHKETTITKMENVHRKNIWTTPLGQFKSSTLAGKSHRISHSTVVTRCRSTNPRFSEWFVKEVSK